MTNNATKSTEAQLVCVGTVKIDGKYYPPGATIVVNDPDQRERLLRLGAAMQRDSLVKAAPRNPPPAA